jgi:hypothetical protein
MGVKPRPNGRGFVCLEKMLARFQFGKSITPGLRVLFEDDCAAARFVSLQATSGNFLVSLRSADIKGGTKRVDAIRALTHFFPRSFRELI